MTLLITGANGLLGQKLVKLILEKGDNLIATSRGKNRNPDLPPENYTQLDITEPERVHEFVDQYRPSAVINTAAMTMVDQCESDREACWKMNVSAVEYLTKACAEFDAHLIHLSTDFIFDGNDGPYTEEATPNPLSYYGESKLAGEQIIQEGSSRWAILRTVLVYGLVHDMSRSNIILWVKENLAQGKKLKIVNDQWRTPTLAEDLAVGCYLAAKKQAQGIYNISGKDLLTPYDMAMATAEIFHLDTSLIEKADSSTFTQPAKRPPKTGFILDKASRDLGYDPHTFKEGLAILKAQLERNSAVD